MERKHSIKNENATKRIFAVILSLALLIGATACGSNSGQSEGGQDIKGQIEGDSTANSASEPVVEESESSAETEVPENTTDGVETANILIAYFSRVGNMNFDENIDAVTSAGVNMDGSNVFGNAQLLAEMTQEVTGGVHFLRGI